MNMWNVAVAVIALALLLPAVNIGLADEADDLVANETTTVDYDENYALGNQSVYAYDAPVVEVGGSKLAEGTDYEFEVAEGRFGQHGEIDWIDTMATVDGDDATVNYTFQNHSQQTKNQHSILESTAAWVPYILLVLGSMLAVKVAGGGGF